MNGELLNKLNHIADYARHADNCHSRQIRWLNTELDRARDQDRPFTALELEIKITDLEQHSLTYRMIANRIEDAILAEELRENHGHTFDKYDTEENDWEGNHPC